MPAQDQYVIWIFGEPPDMEAIMEDLRIKLPAGANITTYTKPGEVVFVAFKNRTVCPNAVVVLGDAEMEQLTLAFKYPDVCFARGDGVAALNSLEGFAEIP